MTGVGQTVRGRRPTILTDELVDVAVSMLAQRVKKHAIRRKIEEALERRLTNSTFEKLLTLARTRLLKYATPDPDEELAKAIAFYETVIENLDEESPIRIKAQERLDAIMGHDARYRRDLTGHDALARKLREALQLMEEDGE